MNFYSASVALLWVTALRAGLPTLSGRSAPGAEVVAARGVGRFPTAGARPGSPSADRAVATLPPSRT